MDFFQGEDVQSFFAHLYNELTKEVDGLSDAEIVSCNFQKWVDYFSSQYYIAPIVLFEENIERTLFETKVKREKPFLRSQNEEKYFETDGVRITFRIYFDGNYKLFYLRPNSYILSYFGTKSFVRPYEKNCGSFTLDFEYTKQELQDKNEAMFEYVKNQFDHDFESYKRMIGYVNAEVDPYNIRLNDFIIQLLEQRKRKADSLLYISNTLQIPLKPSENAPNITPIPLKRIVHQPPAKPTTQLAKPESCISDSDYENINNIISLCGITMEKTARTYYANHEEELRDHLLAALNTHYDAATGETFRKIGKTDINIEFDNKAAYIGECKIWHGEKVFEDAVQQVISYSTWRDVKVSVIVFNKENQSFREILSKIKRWVDTNIASYTQPKDHIWKCKYHRQDINTDIQLTILAFDLYVDKNQFKDSRYKN